MELYKTLFSQHIARFIGYLLSLEAILRLISGVPDPASKQVRGDRKMALVRASHLSGSSRSLRAAVQRGNAYLFAHTAIRNLHKGTIMRSLSAT